MARNFPQLTLKANGKLNHHSLNRLKELLEAQRILYNACLLWLRPRRETDRYLLRDSLRKEFTALRQADPIYRNIHRKISDGILERAITSHLRHAAPDDGAEPAGRPRLKSTERFRTITILSRDKTPVVHVTHANTFKLKLKGLPAIRLATSQALPADKQPSAVHVTLKRGQLHIRLVYDQPEYPDLKNKSQVKTALGIDLGVAISIAVSNGLTFLSPNEENSTANSRTRSGNSSEPSPPPYGWDTAASKPYWITPTTGPHPKGPAQTGTGMAESADQVLPESPRNPLAPLRPHGSTETRLPTPRHHQHRQRCAGTRYRPHRRRKTQHTRYDRFRQGHRGQPRPERPGKIRPQPLHPPTGLGRNHRTPRLQGPQGRYPPHRRLARTVLPDLQQMRLRGPQIPQKPSPVPLRLVLPQRKCRPQRQQGHCAKGTPSHQRQTRSSGVKHRPARQSRKEAEAGSRKVSGPPAERPGRSVRSSTTANQFRNRLHIESNGPEPVKQAGGKDQL